MTMAQMVSGGVLLVMATVTATMWIYYLATLRHTAWRHETTNVKQGQTEACNYGPCEIEEEPLPLPTHGKWFVACVFDPAGLETNIALHTPSNREDIARAVHSLQKTGYSKDEAMHMVQKAVNMISEDNDKLGAHLQGSRASSLDDAPPSSGVPRGPHLHVSDDAITNLHLQPRNVWPSVEEEIEDKIIPDKKLRDSILY